MLPHPYSLADNAAIAGCPRANVSTATLEHGVCSGGNVVGTHGTHKVFFVSVSHAKRDRDAAANTAFHSFVVYNEWMFDHLVFLLFTGCQCGTGF